MVLSLLFQAFQVVLAVKNLPANAGDMGSIPGLGRSPGEGNGNTLQYSCLEGYSPLGRKRVRHDVATKQQ